MSAQLTDTTPITRTVLVDCGVGEAFDAFTTRIAEWWPLRRHSVFGEDARSVVVEPREGGEVYEINGTGGRAHWATVTSWEPPHRLVLAWRVNPETPAATEIDITFEAQGQQTLVRLEHRGWELLGPELGPQGRESYQEGWAPVLARFAELLNG
jgi:uncharacterized protein YndB with AHSA1/START domain